MSISTPRRTVRLLTGLVAAAALGLLAPAAPAQAVYTDDPHRYAVDAGGQTNDERQARSLKALSYNSCLKTYSQRQAQAMAKAKRIYHQDLGPILSRCNLSRVGENVASGYPTGYQTVKGWMGSPGHRANILSTGYRQMSVSAARDSSGRWYVAQVFATPR